MSAALGGAENTDGHQPAPCQRLDAEVIKRLEHRCAPAFHISAERVEEDLAKQDRRAEPTHGEGLVLARGLVLFLVFGELELPPRPALERTLQEPSQVAE